jgi:hypothetical protein
VAPLALVVGEAVVLTAAVSDAADVVFRWSATPTTGTFANATSPTTTFTTRVPGTYALTATLTHANCTPDTVTTEVSFAADGSRQKDGGR